MVTFSFYSFCHLFHHTIRLFPDDTNDFITLYGISEAAVKTLGVAYEPLRDAYRLAVPDTAAATALIVKHPEVFKDYEITKGKMDDVFLAVTGKALEGGAEK